jgi:type I restriction enzyme S subunit
MGNNWETTTLGEIALDQDGAVDGPFGSNLPASCYVDVGIPVIRGSNLSKGLDEFKDEGFVFVSDEIANKLSRSKCIAGDIIFTKKGTLGQTGIVRAEHKYPVYLLSSNQMRLRVDTTKAIPEYVYYWVSSKRSITKLIKDSECTGVPKINLAYLKSFPIDLPCVNEQQKIIGILNSINSKIELNNQTNQTLEQMAQALFKSWFVDFDPVFDNLLASVDFNLDNLEGSLPDELKQRAQRRLVALDSLENVADVKASLSALAHESQAFSPTQAAETPVKPNFTANPKILAQHANTHAHFPNEFEHNEQLGWIPKGWEYGPFSKIAVLKTESVHPKKSPDKLWSQFSLPAFDSGKTPTLDLGIEIKSGKYKLSDNVVLVSKLNPQTPRVWMPNVVDVESSVCSTEFMPFEPILKEHKPFIYALMSSKFIQTEIASRVTGTTGSHQRVSPKNIAVLDVILPSENCIKLYCEMVGSSFNKINLISSQSTELTKLRDTLLPKLISGELQIPNVANDEEVVD